MDTLIKIYQTRFVVNVTDDTGHRSLITLRGPVYSSLNNAKNSDEFVNDWMIEHQEWEVHKVHLCIFESYLDHKDETLVYQDSDYLLYCKY